MRGDERARERGPERALDVHAVVVAYRPQADSLRRLLSALQAQAGRVLLIDNGGDAGWLREEFPAVCYVLAPENLGVAAGANRGAELAFAAGARHVVLFDQDSEPSPGMLVALRDALHEAGRGGGRIAAVGPRFADQLRADSPPFVRIREGRLRAVAVPPGERFVEVDFLITSGCLISREAWEAVGGMDERLFIDYVDIEWGLRARELGWKCLGVADVAMNHAIGEEPIRFLGKLLSVHSPLRRYYQFRNTVWLFRQPSMPRDWKRSESRRFVLKFLFYAFAVAPRLQTLRMMCLGVWHGLRGRMGRLS